ncbi:hypothetical protein Taro_015546 [Colocasia esculenta]|uniref:Uncharacterized protein n=1 Tax=Colocasia esculenta TaxID=4460 RepID=A0A843UMH9_COLES|nr:hypothetical protein [Colocasia esculenta]
MPRTQASVGPKTSLISKLRRLAAIHCKWTQDIGCARQEMIEEHSHEFSGQSKHIPAKHQKKMIKMINNLERYKQSNVYTNLSQVVSTQSTCVLTQSASRVDTLNGFAVEKNRFCASLIRRERSSPGDLLRLGGELDIEEASPTPVCDLHQQKDRICDVFEHLLGLTEEGFFGKLIPLDNFSQASEAGTSIPEEDIVRSDSEREE